MTEKPMCPVWCEPCLENRCSAFRKRSNPIYRLEGHHYLDGPIRSYFGEGEPVDHCGMFNRDLPNKIIGKIGGEDEG